MLSEQNFVMFFTSAGVVPVGGCQDVRKNSNVSECTLSDIHCGLVYSAFLGEEFNKSASLSNEEIHQIQHPA